MDDIVVGTAPHPTFSVCIVTRNRPDNLDRAIQSVLASQYPAHEIIVSDDSTDARTREMVRGRYPEIMFLEGPRRGLSANRNNAVRSATGTHVLFLDDDALVDERYFSHMAEYIRMLSQRETTIVTGIEINRGERVFPHKTDFLGFQKLDYQDGDRIETIVINAAVFPIHLFTRVHFDECLIYGCDEVDIAAQAMLYCNATINLQPQAANWHYPSLINRSYYAPYTEASRIYVTFKKYWQLEGCRAKAIAFLLIALTHNALHNIKTGGATGTSRFLTTLRTSIFYIGTLRTKTSLTNQAMM